MGPQGIVLRCSSTLWLSKCTALVCNMLRIIFAHVMSESTVTLGECIMLSAYDVRMQVMLECTSHLMGECVSHVMLDYASHVMGGMCSACDGRMNALCTLHVMGECMAHAEGFKFS